MSTGNEECAFYCRVQKVQMLGGGGGLEPPGEEGSRAAVGSSAALEEAFKQRLHGYLAGIWRQHPRPGRQ